MIWTQICEHNRVTITGGKPTKNCKTCSRKAEEAFFVPNIEERYNIGLNCITHGVRDAEKKAKRLGLTPIGDAPIEKVFRSEEKTSRRIAEEVIRENYESRRIVL